MMVYEVGAKWALCQRALTWTSYVILAVVQLVLAFSGIS